MSGLNTALTQAVAQFGLGHLQSAVRVPGLQYHSTCLCRTSEGAYALKRLTVRPELPGWLARFQNAFSVEQFLFRTGADFVAEPFAGVAGDGLATGLDGRGNRWYFTARRWVEGHQLEPEDISQSVAYSVRRAILETADAPLSLLLPAAETARDPLPDLTRLREELAHVAPADCRGSPVWWDVVDETLSAPISGQSPRLGHRDISYQNVIKRASGEITLVDWENVGVSSIQAEIGSVLVQAMQMTDAPPMDAIAPFVEGRVREEAAPDQCTLGWFRPWLEGHLMFLSYSLANGATERVAHDAHILRVFADRAITYVAALRQCA